MKKINYLCFSILLASLIQGCYGYRPSVEYTAFKNEDCKEKHQSLYLFFEGEEIAFEYEKLGLVEVEGEQFASNTEALDKLKQKAWENCANGLIKIETGYKDRERGVAFVEETEEVYSAKFYKAIAVKIIVDDNFRAKYGDGVEINLKE
ncbi:hypothetical protein [Tenacibaculum jejuense]|uniref:Probable lipoprotein n=1 Tax=Tenacibaculum jejuense TaxID=584609 RepID=A0A238U9S8_9FLAO|nr:hypothetical protein [Tenacibaculum jejuense]SNR15949.1 Probable lipoprotein precursor [Tenacibaculum jejuense]